MEFFTFFRWVLVITVSTTLFWPLTIPLAALAYKVRNGPAPVPFETGAFWARCTFAALGMAVLALVLVGVDCALIDLADLPATVVHLALLMGYVPLAVAFLTPLFALEDHLQGLGVLMVWIFLPGLLLGALHLLGVTFPTALAESWLPKFTP